MRAIWRPSTKQMSLALCVSLIVHTALVSIWLVKRSPGVQFVNLDTRVDGPDDAPTTLTVRDDMPILRFTEPPRVLPAVVRDVGTPSMVPSLPEAQSPVAPVGHNGGRPANTRASSGAASPMHGRLKAGKSIVYVLDRSSSMSENDALTHAKAALIASLRQLGPDVSFQIVAYNSSTQIYADVPQLAVDTNIDRAVAWLQSLKPEGRSAHQLGMRDGLSFKADALFLLTDADDLTNNDVKAIESYIQHPLVLYAVLFSAPHRQEGSPLQRLASQYRGQVRYVGVNQP